MALIVSEVATNALVHDAGDVRVAVLEGNGALRVEVTDDGPGRPVLRRARPDAEGERNTAPADAWGVQERSDGKTVWLIVWCWGPPGKPPVERYGQPAARS